MYIFTIIFLQNFSKIFSKTHQIAPFKKNFLCGPCPRTPLASAWRSFAPCKYPHFYKNILNPPPEMKS